MATLVHSLAPNAHIGKENETGAKMAIDELNAKGTMIGGKKVKFEFDGEDDTSDPKLATTVAKELVGTHVNGIIGHNPKYTQQGFNAAFRVVTNDGQLGGAIGKYAFKDLKALKIALVDDRTAYGQGVAEKFTKNSKRSIATIVAIQFTADKATDFNAILTSIKAKKPDLIFFGGMDALGGPMLPQMHQLDMSTKFMGGDGLCTIELSKLAGQGLKDDTPLSVPKLTVYQTPVEKRWKTSKSRTKQNSVKMSWSMRHTPTIQWWIWFRQCKK